MTTEISDNKYAQLLKEQGNYVVSVKGVDWREYMGFMVPAYLPHCVPKISKDTARKVLKISARPFVRWDTEFTKTENSQWWYVIRRGQWSLEQGSGNTRSKIRRGRKRLYARALTVEEVLKSGYEICKKAAKRYDKRGFVPSQKVFKRKVEAAAKVKGALEFFGVFCGKDLVGYSENYIQNNAVFWESIWYDPEYLPKYSSYVLIDAMLNYYLNDRKLLYVSDGSRRIYHKSEIQDYLIKVFGFTKEYAVLNVKYSAKFKVAVKLAYPFKNVFWTLSDKWTNTTVDNISAVLRQEYIRSSCANL